MPRSMVPFPYSPWPFLDFGQDPDLNGAPPPPYVPGVTIPWSTLPPIAPPPAPPPVVPPSDTPGFDKTFAPQPLPPVVQAPRNPSLADIIAPWMQPPEPEPPPPALPPSETPGLDKAIARINAPTPGFHLTPGLGGFTQPPMWSLPPPPQLLSIPPLPMPPLGGGLGALASHLPPMAPSPSPLILANSGSAAPTMPQPGAGLPETLRRLMPYATEMGDAMARILPSAGAASTAALAAPLVAIPFGSWPSTTIDLGDGLRARIEPDQHFVPIERRTAPGLLGTDVGATWKQAPIGAYAGFGPDGGRAVFVDPDQLREALGDEAANRILNTPGIMPMAKPTDEQPPSASGDNQKGKKPSLPPYQPPTNNGQKPSGDPDNGAKAALAAAIAYAINHGISFTPLAEGGGLQVHEDNGGHLLAKHVGLSDADLAQRLTTENLRTASTFTDRTTAEIAVSAAIQANRAAIQKYLSGTERGYFAIDYASATPVGRSLNLGATQSVPVSNVRVILAKDPAMPEGYRIVTGYPKP